MDWIRYYKFYFKVDFIRYLFFYNYEYKLVNTYIKAFLGKNILLLFSSFQDIQYTNHNTVHKKGLLKTFNVIQPCFCI